jgi:hypothetical protein
VCVCVCVCMCVCVCVCHVSGENIMSYIYFSFFSSQSMIEMFWKINFRPASAIDGLLDKPVSV